MPAHCIIASITLAAFCDFHCVVVFAVTVLNNIIFFGVQAAGINPIGYEICVIEDLILLMVQKFTPFFFSQTAWTRPWPQVWVPSSSLQPPIWNLFRTLFFASHSRQEKTSKSLREERQVSMVLQWTLLSRAKATSNWHRVRLSQLIVTLREV
jgi:hypothetical protein